MKRKLMALGDHLSNTFFDKAKRANPHSSRPRFRSEKPRRDLLSLVIVYNCFEVEPLARRLNKPLGRPIAWDYIDLQKNLLWD